jgi:hypothetical protein
MVLPLRLTLATLLLARACVSASEPTAEPEPQVAPVEVAPVEVEPPGTKMPAVGREARDAPEQVERDGVVLGLWPDECVLLAETAELRVEHHFEFPGACRFAVDGEGQPRAVATDSGPAWMIESSKPIARDCETALRVVVLTSAGPRLSKAEQHVAMCAPGDWDEMMFHVLASEPVPFGTPGASP